MDPSKLSYRNLLINLICEKKVLCDLFGGDKKYELLLQELKKYDLDDEGTLPLQKDLLKEMNLSRTQLMNLMYELYQNFKSRLFNPNAYPISETEVWLFVKTRNDYWPIGVDNLKLIPRKGDDFTVDFVGELWDGRYLTVESVTHELENGAHKIYIQLGKELPELTR